MTLSSKGTVVVVGNGVVLDSGTVKVFTDDLEVVRRVKALTGLYDVVAEENPVHYYIVTAKINPLFASSEAEIAELTANLNQAGYLDANLSITIARNVATFYAGGPVTYTIVVTNNGPHAASTVAITALIPAGLALHLNGATVPAGTTYNSGTGAWAIPSLASGASKTLTLLCDIGTDQGGASIEFEVTAASAMSDLTAGDNSATDTLAVLKDANLSVTLAADTETPVQGATVQLTMTVANAGPDTATGIEGTLPLPSGLTYNTKTVPEGATYDQATGAFTIASIAASANVQIVVTAVVGADQTEDMACIASVTDLVENDHDMSDDTATVTLSIPAANLGITLSADDLTPAQGGDVVFTVTVANAGPANASGITGTLIFPAGLTYKAKSVGAGQTYDQASGAFTIAAINNSANSQFTVTATVGADQTADMVVPAVITGSNQVDAVPGNNSASVTIAVAQANLGISLVPDDDTPAQNASVVFTIAVSNAGPKTATGITGSFVLPAGLTYSAKGVEAGETYDDATGAFTLDSIAANASKQFTVTATVGAGLTDPIPCTATITGANQIDVVAGNDSASTTLTPHA